MAELDRGYACGVCGARHRPLPLSYSAKAPLTLLRVPMAERGERVVMNADQCVIDNAMFFLRGRVPVPIHDYHELFVWGMWAQVSLADFFRTQQRWTTPGRERDASFAGRLDTELPLFGGTLDLEVRVQTQVVGRRPHFEVVNDGHALAREQRTGMTLARAEAIAARLRHGAEREGERQ